MRSSKWCYSQFVLKMVRNFRLAHGLKGLNTFQRVVNLAFELKGLIWWTCLVYLHDVIIWSSSFNEHFFSATADLWRTENSKGEIGTKKNCFLKRSICFLGHVVSAKGIETEPEIIRVVQEWPTLANVAEVCSFSGFVSYCRRYISNVSKSEPRCF